MTAPPALLRRVFGATRTDDEGRDEKRVGSTGAGSTGSSGTDSTGLRDRYRPPREGGAHVTDPFGAAADDVRAAVEPAGSRSPAAFVADHGAVADAVVDAAFERLAAELPDDDAIQRTVERTRTDLTGALEEVFDNLETGVDASRHGPLTDGGTDADAPADGAVEPATGGGPGAADAPVTADASTPGDGEGFPLGAGEILDHVGTTLFVLDAEGEVVHWNRGSEHLTGVSEAEARAVDTVSQAFYHDGRRSQTLADKVLDAPESADEVYGVPRVEAYDFTLYRDRSTMTDSRGEEVEISFSAAPLYDDGELVGVVEMVQDRTEDVRRRERTVELVDELRTTIEAIREGDYDARARFDHEGYVDEDVLAVVEELNDLAAEFGTLATHVAEETEDLLADSREVARTSEEIHDVAEEQTDSMRSVAREIADLSATVEEVASTAAEVDDTSDRAADLATDSRETAAAAVDDLEDVADSAGDVAADVDRLQGRVEEITEIVEVIDDIAEQTNMLALNASIEAARAGQAGEGFAVVADEVKSLAEESRQQASEIDGMVTAIQDDTAETVANLEATTEQVATVTDRVEAAMTQLGDVVESIQSVSHGVQEVADATDEQAASAEAVAGMIDEAVEGAERIADDVEEIAAANETQMEQTEQIRRAIEEHTY